MPEPVGIAGVVAALSVTSDLTRGHPPGESTQLTAGTLRAEPLGMMSDGQGNVAVRVRVSATRPDGRAHDDPQILLFRVEGDQVASVDQYIGNPTAVTAFWA